jgi:hypothetical protein
MRLDEIPTFADDGKAFRVVVESPRGSSVKLKYDRELGAMALSRPLPTGVVFRGQGGQGFEMDRPSGRTRRLPLLCRFLCRTRFCSALLATFVGTLEHGS